ncbi:MAG: primosomal protein N' [Acidobacteriota bacterium]|nr:primosomal protein N' [Acidobacteriota bacterium]
MSDLFPKQPERFFAVAVPAPLLAPYSYKAAGELADGARAGVRVRVPLGRRVVTGVILGPAGPPPEGVEAREIVELIDDAEHPALPPDLIETVRWASEYYVAPPGDAARAAVPAAAAPTTRIWARATPAGRAAARSAAAPPTLSWLCGRRGARALWETFQGRSGGGREAQALVDAGWVEREEVETGARGSPATRRVVAVAAGVRDDRDHLLAGLTRTPARRRALLAALESPPLTPVELARKAGVGVGAVRALVTGGLLEERTERLAVEPPPAADVTSDAPPELTPDQRAAVAHLNRALTLDRHRSIVLFGVTGSGKTEVYLRAAKHSLARGRPVLFLVPEIALTPQLSASLQSRFGDAVVVQHSGLSDRQRFEAWTRAREGSAKVVVGARSALFAPLLRPGLIVVDEEHDTGYKQEESPRYHARDLALVRGQAADGVVVLGSATPSMEAWSRAQEGRSDLIELKHRIGSGGLPEIEVVDMRDEFRETGSTAPLSRRLTERLISTVERGEQAMVLLNRRGFSRVLLCRSCGDAVSCNACSIPLTWHRQSARLLCHYCGHARRRPVSCPGCDSRHLVDLGSGTERLEQDVAALLPSARVARLDRDTARSTRRLVDLLGRFSRREIDVLVGTQMIAKGHHFPRVTLVGVVSADSTLCLPDFRAGERTFQLITQVSGRAGRGDRTGAVVVQAFRPDHPALAAAARQDFPAFASRELATRRALRYPPSAAMANILVRDRDRDRAFERASELAARIREAGAGHVAVLGPTAAPLARLREQWRVQMLVRARKRRRVIGAVRHAVAETVGPHAGMPRWLVIDIDPQQLL